MIDTRTLMQSVGVAAIVLAAGLSAATAQQTVAPASATPVPGPMPDILQKYTPVTAERLKKPEDGNWLLFRRTYDGWGYSPLAEITPANVSRLQPVWSYATGQIEGHQAPPIVNNGVMFVATPGNQLLALEAKTGNLLWRYKRPFPEDMTPLHPTNRGVGLFGDKVFFAAAESVLVALNAKTGKEVWATKVDDYKVGHYMTLMPLVIDGKVLVAASGGELGIRGFLAAYDAETGKELWRTYTVPAPGEPGSDTWPAGGDHYKRGGAHDVGDRQLRPGDQSHLLGHRQRRPVVRRSAPRRQSLHDVRGRLRRHHRRHQGTLPVSPEQLVGLGRGLAADRARLHPPADAR